ncbi:MAG: response regulator transcription factor [Saprospiraceae bacterium]|jgi:DNA-binding LytR/AlgR family response regulator|nr:response regulator transcription factor [Saprospiraceae bacterium]
MNKINVLIVDDEPLALDILETFVNQIPDLHLVARCSNAMEAGKVLSQNHVDAIFLDIQMPQMTGIEFMKSLTNPPLVIFTTAYPNFALDGFELDALDYLLKPISFERFFKSVNKLKDYLNKNKVNENEPLDDKDFFFVKADKKLMKINYNEITYVEGLKDYVIIWLEQTRIITLQTMKSLEEKLDSKNFKRIHRSFIVNLKKISALNGSMVEISFKGQLKQLPVGKNYKDELLQIIGENKL